MPKVGNRSTGKTQSNKLLEYAQESAAKKQYNKIRIKVPFVLGVIIDLCNCLNLIESDSINILKEAYTGLKKLKDLLGDEMPVNRFQYQFPTAYSDLRH